MEMAVSGSRIRAIDCGSSTEIEAGSSCRRRPVAARAPRSRSRSVGVRRLFRDFQGIFKGSESLKFDDAGNEMHHRI
jgi:hypothetical protein